MDDLFGDLPPESTTGPGGSSSSATQHPHAAFGATAVSLKPRTTLASSSHIMAPPPKRPAPRSAGGVARTAATAPVQPIDIHASSSSSEPLQPGGPAEPTTTTTTSSSMHDRAQGQGQGEQDNWESLEGPEAYDPAKPNDYMEYCQQRLARKQEAERRRELEKYMRVKEEEEARARHERRTAADAFPPPGQAPLQQAPAAPAVGRGRGRGGISNLPAWMVKQQQEQGGGAAAGAEPAAAGGGGGIGQGPPGAAEEGRFADAAKGGGARGGGGGGNIGAMLLKKMGYKEGEGLGREAQGITKPIQYRAVGGGQGTVSGPSLRQQQQQPPPPPAAAAQEPPPQQQAAPAAAAGGGGGRRKRGLFSNPTKVVLLKNMVAPGEVDEELHAETKEECEKHGPVKEVMIFEAPPEALPAEERVRIFVAFERQESAVKAYVAMNGRFFGGRQVQASFFDEARFAQRDLAPRAGE